MINDLIHYLIASIILPLESPLI